MAKEKVKHLSAVFASMFAHAGHITKEEAKEISGMADHEFEKAYDKASVIADKVVKSGDSKMGNSWTTLPRRLKKISRNSEKRFFK